MSSRIKLYGRILLRQLAVALLVAPLSFGQGVHAQEGGEAPKKPAANQTKDNAAETSGAAADKQSKPAVDKGSDKADSDSLLEGLSDDLLKKLEEEAKGEVEAEPKDPPLIRIGDHMRQVQKRLAERDTGSETIELQARIIREIDELLKQLQQNQNQNNQQNQQNQQNQAARRDQAGAQQQQQQQSSSQTSTQAARDGQRVMPRGPDARSKAELERMARAVWGHLPPKVREQMEQAFSASFLPQYEPLIERYFRALAERGAGVR